MQRTLIKYIENYQCNQTVEVRGWVRTVRQAKDFLFIELNDGSQLANLQIIANSKLDNYDELKTLTTGSSLAVLGALVESPGKGQKFEVQAQKIEIYQIIAGEDYPLQKKRHSFEFLRENAHLRARTNTFGAVFRVRHTLAQAVHQFFNENDFFYVQTPLITGSDCEGAGEMFKVTTLDLENLPQENGLVDYRQDFFGKKTGLTVSGQLEGELLATSLGRIYTFGPTFRAENSNTTRHLSEFWMIEPEMSFANLKDDMVLAESFLKYIFSYCLKENPQDLEFFDRFVKKGLIANLEGIINSDFEILSYTEAVKILQNCGEKFEYPVEWGIDLQSEHERYLTEKKVGRPVILTDYPKEIKAFYMKNNDDGKTVAAMDVLVPGIGEIIGGSEREWRYQVLLDRMQEAGLNPDDYWWYLDTRRFGSVPHAGFGLGFERTVQFITGMQNIRDVIPFPRTPKTANF